MYRMLAQIYILGVCVCVCVCIDFSGLTNKFPKTDKLEN